MAILKNNLNFTGRLGNATAYSMRGHDEIIIRTKGGASRKRIKTDVVFETTRNLNNEWKGVTKAALDIRDGLYALRPMADYNISGPLNALVKKLQVLDTVNPKGKRSILFSSHPGFISSFQYNRKTLFDTVIRQPLDVSIDKATGIAEVTIPALQPGINFFSHPGYSYFRMVLAFTAVSDYILDDRTGNYISSNSLLPEYKAVYTDWMATNRPQPSADYKINPHNTFLPGAGMILVLGAGIQYGVPAVDGSIEPAPYVGAARVIKSV